ncbi:MAG TPA: phage integrase SAM-like domain-containing protein [Sediminibacterium sp.]|jgi:integrase|nr:phage integrase SAM-like domain-containing protein [Sediminibacterium sp.]
MIPEPRFYLKDQKSKEPTLIYLDVRYTSLAGIERFTLTTGEKIRPEEWNLITQRAIVSKQLQKNSSLNFWLEKMVNTFKSEFRNFQIEGTIPTAAILKAKVNGILNIIPIPVVDAPKQKLDLFPFIEQFIKDCVPIRKEATIKTYWGTYRKMKLFAEMRGIKSFGYNDITLEWRSQFIKFLQSKGVSRNTEGKHIKTVKVFMNEATERNLNTNLAFRSKGFQKPSEDIHKIFLTMEKITKLANLDLADDRLQDIIRDYFIISCLTALRYSDVTRICKENIKDGFIEIKTVKTGQEVVIPISPLVKNILIKYNYDLPKAPCNQVFNRYLKEIGKKAELDESILVTRTIGGIKKTEVKREWELLSSHVGRRSLISNCILEGINTSSLMVLSAHRSLRSFQSYVRISQQQNAEALTKYAIFS